MNILIDNLHVQLFYIQNRKMCFSRNVWFFAQLEIASSLNYFTALKTLKKKQTTPDFLN